MPYFVLIPYACLLVIYLVFEQKRNFTAATTLKLSLSFVFCAVSLIAAILESEIKAELIIFSAGFVFAFFGDYFLQYIVLDNAKFKKGIVFFALTQVCFICAMYLFCPVSYVEFLFFAAFIAVALVLMKSQKWDVSAQNPHITVYTALLSFMAAKAAAVSVFLPHLWFIGAGALLFYVSDMILGIWNYKKRVMPLAHLNWITYFSGQILLSFGVYALMLYH